MLSFKTWYRERERELREKGRWRGNEYKHCSYRNCAVSGGLDSDCDRQDSFVRFILVYVIKVCDPLLL